MREEKKLLSGEIRDQIDGSAALVITRYNKLTPDLSADFRVELAKGGGAFSVVQKRVLIKAAQELGITLEEKDLQGSIGVLFAKEDPITPTKALFDFAKDHDGLFEILGGRFDGQLYSAADVKAISKLPTQDEMRSQFLGLLEAPMAQTLSTMDALLTCVLHCLENKSQQSSE